MQSFRVFVPGHPAPQGSKTAFVRGGKAVLVEANRGHKSWRDEVINRARLQMVGLEQFKGPLKIELLFELHRGSTVDRQYPNVKPDLDKLSRTIFDALELAGVYRNDSQIIELHARKLYGTTRTGVTIHLDYV